MSGVELHLEAGDFVVTNLVGQGVFSTERIVMLYLCHLCASEGLHGEVLDGLGAAALKGPDDMAQCRRRHCARVDRQPKRQSVAQSER
jgi:hypothetical protein